MREGLSTSAVLATLRTLHDQHNNMSFPVRVIGCASAASIFAAVLYARRRARSRWVRNEDTDSIKAETSHSIIALFEGLVLDPDTTVGEANKRRTSSYYLKMRQSHELSFVSVEVCSSISVSLSCLLHSALNSSSAIQ